MEMLNEYCACKGEMIKLEYNNSITISVVEVCPKIKLEFTLTDVTLTKHIKLDMDAWLQMIVFAERIITCTEGVYVIRRLGIYVERAGGIVRFIQLDNWIIKVEIELKEFCYLVSPQLYEHAKKLCKAIKESVDKLDIFLGYMAGELESLKIGTRPISQYLNNKQGFIKKLSDRLNSFYLEHIPEARLNLMQL